MQTVDPLGVEYTTPGDDPIYTTAGAARYLDMSPSWVRNHQREIGHFKMGGELRFRKSDLDAYLAKARHEPEVKVS
jgi:excisionase family DNA binding protein